jgi:hypothetical protein
MLLKGTPYGTPQRLLNASGKSKSSCSALQKQERVMDATEKLAQMMIRCGLATGHGDTIDDLIFELEKQIKNTSNAFSDAREEIELLRLKKSIAVEMIKELLEFLEFIRNHPPFATDAKAYKWIMFQIEMMAARINEPEEER